MLADSDLRLTGGTHPVFATICDTSPYFFEFSPFVWHLTQFFWCDDVCKYSKGLSYKLGDFLHINWFSEEVLWLNILPNMFFVARLYVLNITSIFSRASYSRCSYCFLIDSSQCFLIPWKQLSPSNIQLIYSQLIEFLRFVYKRKLYGFGRFRLNMSFCTISIYHF